MRLRGRARPHGLRGPRRLPGRASRHLERVQHGEPARRHPRVRRRRLAQAIGFLLQFTWPADAGRRGHEPQRTDRLRKRRPRRLERHAGKWGQVPFRVMIFA